MQFPPPIAFVNFAEKDWWDKSDVLLTGLLAVVGVVGVIYAIKTLRMVERQTNANEGQLNEIKNSAQQTNILIEQAGKQADAARNSADAALLNATAVVNSERPWLFIEIETSDVKPDQSGVPVHVSFSVRFQNWGKTPAEIINFDDHLECRKDTEDLPMPPKYRLEGHVWMHTRMLPPGQIWAGPESYFFVENWIPTDDFQEIRASRKRLLYWGRLQYRDLIGHSTTIHDLKKMDTIHETCFCYFWSPSLNEFLICGPFGYNKHT